MDRNNELKKVVEILGKGECILPGTLSKLTQRSPRGCKHGKDRY